MNMANIITLSSSPPAVFARSPTPVTLSSSPCKTHDYAQNHHNATPPRFRSAKAIRDGFSPGFTTARQVLGAKSSAENVPMTSSRLPTLGLNPVPKSDSIDPNLKPVTRQLPVSNEGRNPDENPQPTIIKILPSDVRRAKKSRDNAPLNLKKAAARRKDWTPPKFVPMENGASDNSVFGMNLQQSFGHVGDNTIQENSSSVEGSSHSKRRKIDLTTAGNKPTSAAQAILTKHTKPTSRVRNKSPTKRAVTITGLTTSHYLEDDHDQENSTLMMQFLASTQARMQSDGSSEMFETSLNDKATKSKKNKSKSRLRSPGTSIKTIGEQDIVFASASQLARDESPTLLRDTVEAIRQSEEESFNENVLIQQTAPISIGSVSPEAGVARYRGRKNLWCAAHRDENDALLYCSDPFDDSEIRAALTGKDALVESGGEVQNAGGQADDSLALLATLHKGPIEVCDIDDLATPLHTATKPDVQTGVKRSQSTSVQTPSKRTKTRRLSQQDAEHGIENADIDFQRPKIPPKPNYASWTDDQLKDQVKEYGFKRLRARKSMIDKLDEHWAEKHGLDVAAVKAATKAASKKAIDRDHGHFLSKVHELAPRPQPKTNKTRTKKANSGPFQGVSKNKSKSKLVETQESTESGHDTIFDIDEIDNMTALERLASIKPFADEPVDVDFLEPSTAPVKGTGVKATARPQAKRKVKPAERPLTPPPTLPEDPILDSSPGFASPHARTPAPVSLTPMTDDADTSLKSHIQTALLHPVADAQRRNHQKNPTWHEKMLLYDPIVLDDFTAWLNTEGFNAIGIDDEIDAKEVKVWCEENGICCLWKGGWRGNKAKE